MSTRSIWRPNWQQTYVKRKNRLRPIQPAPNAFFEPFTYSNGALATVSSGRWIDVGAPAGDIRVVGQRAQTSNNTALYSSAALHGLNLRGNTNWQLDVDGFGALDIGSGGFQIQCVNSVSSVGYGFFAGNAVHIQRFDSGTSHSNLTNDSRPGEGTGGYLQNHVTFIHKANGDIEVYLDGVLWSFATDTSFGSTAFDAILINLTSGNSPSTEAWMDNVNLTDVITGAPVVATPSTVVVTTTVPSPTETASATVTPSVVTVASTVTTPGIASLPQVTAVAVVSTVPSTTQTATATPAPSTVAIVDTIPSPAISASATVATSVVATSTTVPSPAITIGTLVTPSVIAVATTVPTPGVSSAVTTSVIATSSTVPAPTITASATVTPNTVAIAATVPTPSITASATIAPSSVSVIVTVQAPAIQSDNSTTVQPSAVNIVVSIPTTVMNTTVMASIVAIVATPQMPSIPLVISPSVVAVTSVVPSPTITASATVTPAVVAIVTSNPSPGNPVDCTIAASVVAISTTVPGVTITADNTTTVNANTVAILSSIPSPVVQITGGGGGNVSAGVNVPAPGISASASVAPPVRITLSAQIPDPTINIGATPNAIHINVFIPGPSFKFSNTASPSVVAVRTTVLAPVVIGIAFDLHQGYGDHTESQFQQGKTDHTESQFQQDPNHAETTFTYF